MNGQPKASVEEAHVPTSNVVTIPYSDLLDKTNDLSEQLEAGFGPNGLGIIAISHVPKYPVLWKNLLELSHGLAALPEEAKKDLEDADSRLSLSGISRRGVASSIKGERNQVRSQAEDPGTYDENNP